MKPRSFPTGTGIGDRPPRPQRGPAQATTDKDLSLDHHLEEVLAALSDLAGRQSLYPSGSESRPDRPPPA